jgi:hypothetical protein
MSKYSNCGGIGHNKRTCNIYINNKNDSSSSFSNDKQKQVKKNYNYLKNHKKENNISGVVFNKNKKYDEAVGFFGGYVNR